MSHLNFAAFCRRSAGALALGAVLAGCSAPAPKPVTTDAQGLSTQQWAGRMGLLVLGAEGTQTEQSFSGAFELQGTPQAGELHMFNPLGSKVAHIRWSPEGAWLQQGERLTPSDSLPALVQRTLGTDIPIPALFAWLQGQQSPTPGWQVDLSQYPQRITAHRHHPAPQAQLRVVLQR